MFIRGRMAHGRAARGRAAAIRRFYLVRPTASARALAASGGKRFSYSAVIRLNEPSAFMPSSASESAFTTFRSVCGLQARKSGSSFATKTILMSATFADLGRLATRKESRDPEIDVLGMLARQEKARRILRVVAHGAKIVDAVLPQEIVLRVADHGADPEGRELLHALDRQPEVAPGVDHPGVHGDRSDPQEEALTVLLPCRREQAGVLLPLGTDVRGVPRQHLDRRRDAGAGRHVPHDVGGLTLDLALLREAEGRVFVGQERERARGHGGEHDRSERETKHQHEAFQRHGRAARPRASDMGEFAAERSVAPRRAGLKTAAAPPSRPASDARLRRTSAAGIAGRARRPRHLATRRRASARLCARATFANAL